MSQSSTNHRRLALIGGSVGVATAAVIAYLVVAGAPKDEPETRELVRPTTSPSLSNKDIEGGVVKPWEAKQPTAAELAELAKADAEEKAERDQEQAKAEAAMKVAKRDDVANQEAARQAGILGRAQLAQGGAFASLTGTGDISSGFDDDGLIGNGSGTSGGFGYGRSGFGPGGGTGVGTIGNGRYGTIGRGSGTGSGYGVGGGRGGMRGRGSAVPTISIGQPTVAGTGELDKAIIRRYIKRNIQKLQYCYEKELLAKPTLAGTVVTQFTITESGAVGSASGSGVSPEVSSCMANVVKGIEFPKPKGTGGVSVTYPFTVRPAGP